MSENKVNAKDRLNIGKKIEENNSVMRDLADKMARLVNMLDKIKTEYNDKKSAYDQAILEKAKEEARKKQAELAAQRKEEEDVSADNQPA